MSDEQAQSPKPWWASRAIWGAVVTVGVGIAGVFGWSVDAAQTTELVFGLVTLVSGAVAWWGTVQRSRPIDKQQVLPGLRLNRSVLPDASSVQRNDVPAKPGGPGSNPFLDS